MKIALVDDEPMCLDEMTRLCSDFGTRYHCQVETVPFLNGETFLEAFGDGGFSAVFMDIYMDGIDGVAAALKMRGIDSRCVLVFLTSSMDFMPDAFSCHAFEYITKPFSQQRIFQVHMTRWLSALPNFLVLLPSAASCYYTMENQMKYTLRRTAALCTAVLLPYAFLCSALSAMLRIDVNIILLPSLILFFFPYRCTVTASLPKCLAVYVGVCAVQTFPAQFAYSFDAFLHPSSGAANFSIEAAFFQLGLSCLVAAAFAWPACKLFFRVVDCLDIPKIWYSTIMLSSVLLIFNVLVQRKLSL